MALTHIKYTDTALPVQNNAVTLFDSTAACRGMLRHLGWQWLQYRVRFDGAGGTITGSVTGDYSEDGGTSWTNFYTSAALDDDTVYLAEVYIGMLKDVRFRFTPSNESANAFVAHVALAEDKAEF